MQTYEPFTDDEDQMIQPDESIQSTAETNIVSSNKAKNRRTELPRILDGVYFNEISEHPNDGIWAKCTVSTCERIVKGNKTSTIIERNIQQYWKI